MQNTFYHGDCLFVMRHDIKPESVDLIYLDPPFFTGKIQKGQWRPEAMEVSFQDSRKFWKEKGVSVHAPHWLKYIAIQRPDFASYIYYMMLRLQACHDVLKKTGSIYLHCDWKAAHYLKMIMDEIFGYKNFQNEIIWGYKTQGASKRRFASKHDNILFYSKSDKWTFNTQYEKSLMMHKYGFKGSDFKVDPKTGEQYNIIIARDIWEIPALQSATKEKIGFPTQKPLALLEKIIQASSNEHDIVLDPFCGCGTCIIAAHKLNRQWIGIDINKFAYDTTKGREKQLPLGVKEDFLKVQYVTRDLAEVAELSPSAFEVWVNQFYGANKPYPDKGVDGITQDGVPIQSKTYEIKYDKLSQFTNDVKYHPKVPQPIKKVIAVSQTGFDDSARKLQFAVETAEGIKVALITPQEMLKLDSG